MNPITAPFAVQHSISIAAEPELVWHAWTRADRVTAWFAPEAVIEAHEQGAFELYFIPGNAHSMNTRGCRITRIQEPSLLEFTWRGPDQFSALMNDEGTLTLVTVDIAATDDGNTLVSVQHRGFGGSEAWEEAREWHQAAWVQALGSLKAALESGAGDLCCRP